MKSTLTLSAFALLGLASCQPASSVPTVPRQVRSVGYGSVTVYPDFAELTVDVAFTRPKLKDAVAEVQGLVDQILVLSKRYAPGPNDVRVSSTSTDKEFDYVKNKEVFRGYNTTQSVTVRIADLKSLSPYIEQLLATRVRSIRNITYGHTRADSLRHEASMLALVDAGKSADKMCTALHLKRGAVLEASDSSSPESNQSSSSNDIQLYSKSFGGRTFKMSPELLRFESTCSLSSVLE